MRTAVPLVVAVLVCSLVDIGSGGLTITEAAAKRRRSKSRASKPRPKPAVVQKPATGTPTPSLEGDTQELLARANKLYDNLEYEQVIPVAEAVLARPDATIDMQLDAFLLHGSSLAIVGDPIEAEKPFRFLLRGRPDYDMPAETPPKILAVFRKVQVEERAIAQQMAELERARIVRELEVEPEVPEEATGGVPLEFSYKLRDPGRAVQSMSLHYRRASEPRFSALALQIDNTGTWTGELPGEWTENEDGFELQYYVTTADVEGRELLTVGGATDPLNLAVAPGSVADARPIYTTWWFWTVAGVVTVAAGIGGYLLYDKATALPETQGLVEVP